MDLFEWQAKELFAKYGVPTTRQVVIATAEDARAAAESLGGGPVMLKAQVKPGGRGKAGGVKFAPTADDAVSHARHRAPRARVGLPVDYVGVRRGVPGAGKVRRGHGDAA